MSGNKTADDIGKVAAQLLEPFVLGLLNGSKRVVVISEATAEMLHHDNDIDGNAQFMPVVHYKHTLKVEDTNDTELT